VRRRRPFALSLSARPNPFPSLTASSSRPFRCFVPGSRRSCETRTRSATGRVCWCFQSRPGERDEWRSGGGEEKEFGWFRRSVRFGFGVGGSHKSKQQKRLTRKQMKTNMGSRTARAPMPESGRRRKAGGKTAMACSSAAISQ